MGYLLQRVRRYPLTTVVTIAIWVLSLGPIPETPLNDVRFIDKWTHIVMYGGLSLVVWVEYLWHHRRKSDRRKITIWGWLVPVLMGGTLELLQAYCTGGRRSGDWYDFAANALGATLVLCGGTLWLWLRAKGQRA